uniref:Uncharacterized protein n=1 Tax=Pithovirus LCPAC403 TaxID=2506596 RepID=A0A481ZBY5_9VIRU|nr:MAG: protein of unknown function DUF1664 [Pithovirus LCPAC403]
MDSVKSPQTMVAAVSLAAVAGGAVYVTKQFKVLKEDIATINEEINILKSDDNQEKKIDKLFSIVEALSQGQLQLKSTISELSKRIYILDETLKENNLKVSDDLRNKVYGHRQVYNDPYQQPFQQQRHIHHHPPPPSRDPISEMIHSVQSSINN